MLLLATPLASLPSRSGGLPSRSGGLPSRSGGAPQAPSEADLGRGVGEVRAGEFARGIATLEAFLRALGDAPGRDRERARACAYLGVAYLALSQEAAARERFLEALRASPGLDLASPDFPPEALRVFEETRQEASSGSGGSSQGSTRGGGGHEGRTTKIVLGTLGAAAVAGGVVAIAHHDEPSNRPPTAAAISVAPDGTAIAGATVVAFTATAHDPDHDSLSYAWDFGDGGTATGAIASHVFAREGTFRTALKVADGRGGTTSAETAVAARRLTGRWILSGGGGRFYEDGYDIVQSGPALGGHPFAGRGAGEGCLGELAGVVTSPRAIRFTFVGCDGETVVVEGTVSADLTFVTGTYTHPSGPPQPIRLSRS